MIASITDLTFFGLEMIDVSATLKLIFRFLFSFFFVFVIVRLIYYPKQQNKQYLFTYFLLSTVIFLLCFLLDNVKLQLGFALGLFAIFGILRYRTDTIPIKEMTYLFVVIGLSVINALANKKISLAELTFTNTIVVIMVYGYEYLWLLQSPRSKKIVYEKIELIHADNTTELIADLEERTGLNIERVEVGSIDFLKDVANVTIHYTITEEERSSLKK